MPGSECNRNEQCDDGYMEGGAKCMGGICEYIPIGGKCNNFNSRLCVNGSHCDSGKCVPGLADVCFVLL